MNTETQTQTQSCNLATAEAIILDTETTGLQKPEPIEIALMYLQSLSKYKVHLDDMESLLSQMPYGVSRYKPSKPIEPTASKIHGIYLEDVAGFPGFGAQTFKDDHLPDTVQYIIGHTIRYDIDALNCIAGGADGHFSHLKPIDVCKIARRLWPEFKEGRSGYKLTQITEKLFPDLKPLIEQKAHGALADVYFTYLILAGIVHQYEPETWEDVYLLQVK